jgi:hypothetical protein
LGSLFSKLGSVLAIGKPEFVTICHAAGQEGTTHFNTLTLPYVAVYGEAGHFYENGTPQAGHEDDYLGECEVLEGPGDYNLPSMSASVICGEAELTFNNPTPFFFSFDYRVDGEAGTPDEVSSLIIANGPWAGQSFGDRYNIVDVLTGTTEVESVSFPEDSGIHTVAYRLWRGAENDWYLPWQEVQVESDCEENEIEEPVKASTLGYNLTCNESDFTVDMDLTEDGQPVAGILVNFSYNGLNASDTTDAGGRARVSFPAQGNYTVQANPDGGYPSKSLEVHMPEDCPAGETIQVGGQVLGASTLASTGSGEELALAGQIALLFSGQAGLAMLIKKKLFA